MNKLSIYSLIVFAIVILSSCSKDEAVLEPIDTYVKYYGNSYIDEAYEMLETADGGYIFAGKSENSNEEKSSIVIKVAANGNEEWSKTYGIADEEEAKHIVAAHDGGYIIGSNHVDALGNQTMYLTKIGESGNQQWRQQYMVNDSSLIEKVIATSDNHYLILSNTTKATANNNPGRFDVLLIKVDVSGNVVWSQQSGFDGDDLGFDVIEKLSLDEYVIVGTSSNSTLLGGFGGTDVLVFQANSVGNESGAVIYGGSLNEAAFAIEPVSDGYLICGETQSNGNGSKDVYYLKIGLNIFSLTFEKYFGGPGIDVGNCIAPSNSGQYLIGGTTESFGAGAFDSYLIKVDGSGNEIFNKTYGGSGDENINDIISLSDNKILMLGTNSLGGNQSISLIKAKEDGELN
jgi:hypothetical protein